MNGKILNVRWQWGLTQKGKLRQGQGQAAVGGRKTRQFDMKAATKTRRLRQADRRSGCPRASQLSQPHNQAHDNFPDRIPHTS